MDYLAAIALGRRPETIPGGFSVCPGRESRDLNFATFRRRLRTQKVTFAFRPHPRVGAAQRPLCVPGQLPGCPCSHRAASLPSLPAQGSLVHPTRPGLQRTGQHTSLRPVHDVHKQRSLSWHCLMRRCRPAPRERWRLKRATLEFSILAGSVVAACKRHTEWRRCTVVVLMHGKSLADHALLPARHRPHASLFGHALESARKRSESWQERRWEASHRPHRAKFSPRAYALGGVRFSHPGHLSAALTRIPTPCEANDGGRGVCV